MREGLDLAVGQTINLPVTLKVSSASRRRSSSPATRRVIETTRAEGADRIDEQAIAEPARTTAATSSTSRKLTPGVAIVQGPDGDELSINGQKGIHNNISVDGADFNNPFFGEQRGGQRPAFTFNLDAVKEIVVVADGANAEFGRSIGGFVNVVTKSGTNDIHGTAHVVLKNDALSSAPKRADGTSADKFDFTQHQAGFTLGGPLEEGQGSSTSSPSTTRTAARPSRPTRRASSSGWWTTSRASAPRTRTAPSSAPTTPGSSWARSTGRPQQKHLATLRYNYTWSEQENGTFDVDSWGRSANAIEKDYSHAVSGSLDLEPVGSTC